MKEKAWIAVKNGAAYATSLEDGSREELEWLVQQVSQGASVVLVHQELAKELAFEEMVEIQFLIHGVTKGSA